MKKLLLISMITIIMFSIIIPVYCEDEIVINNTLEKEIIKFNDSNLEEAIRTVINKPKGNILYEDVKDIKKLYAANKNIFSLEGIEHLINLEELNLKENNISDITPIAGLKDLRYLNLWKNNISDISPLKNLVKLQQLDLDSNEIRNIESLKELHNLKALRLGSNKLIDISPIENLNKLEYLCLWSNKVIDITPLRNLKKLIQLRLAYNEIYDISPLSNLNSLQNINLINNRVRDISALSNLSNLKALYLINNEISDIGALSELENIERLRLDNNYISDIEGLERLNNLRLLTLSKNTISDTAPLKDKRKIEYLDLRSNEIKDIKALSDANNLVKLFLDENNIYDIDILSNKEKLITLSASNNNVDDMSSLYSLINLKYLDLSYNNIKTLESLNTLSNLKNLYLDDNLITDIGPIKENINIKSLSLENNDINKIESIKNLVNLENLNLADNQISDISCLKGNINLKVLKLHNNQITDFSSLQDLKNLEIIRTIDYWYGKDTVAVQGKVTDLYNDEFKGSDTYVTMINLNKENNRVLMDVTNECGEFAIQGIFPGEYKIVFTKKGYKPLTMYRTIDFNSDEINVKLELDPEISWIRKETERVVYNYKDGIDILDVEINLQEKRLMEIEKFFDIEMKNKVNFFICTYPEEIYELAYNTKDYYALGTYKSSTNSVYTIGKAFDFHETCHAVEHKFNPHYNLSLGEGLAMYFGSYKIGSPIALNRPVDDLARELMIKGELEDVATLLKGFNKRNDYIANGSLVTFLLNNYSDKQFRDLFKILPNRPTEEKLESVFKEVYNKSINEIQDEWLNYLNSKMK